MALQNVIAVDNGKVIGVNEGIPVDSVTDGDMRPVTSNAVYDYLNDSVSVTKQSSDTSWGSIVQRLYALIDFSRINANSILILDGIVYRVYSYGTASVVFQKFYLRYSSDPGINADILTIRSDGGYHYAASLSFSSNAWTGGLDSSVPNSMTIFYR